MVTLTATESASLQPVLDPGTAPLRGGLHAPVSVALMADPLGLRRLEALLGGRFEITVRGQEVDALLRRASAPFDLAILSGGGELSARGGAIELLTASAPSTRIVVMAKRDERSLVRRVLRAGAHGLVCERAIDTALLPTIRAALAGQVSVPPTIRSRIAWRTVSLREQQVLWLVARGMTNGEIAHQLCLSESTVKTHLSSSFRKLGVLSRAEAAALVLDPEHGLPRGVS